MIEQQLQQKRLRLERLLGSRQALQKQLDEKEREVDLLTIKLKDTETAVMLLQQYAEDQQKVLAERVEAVVTEGIRRVFQDDKLTFKMRYSEGKAGLKKKPEVTLHVSYDFMGEEVEGSLASSFGGGLAAVISCLLNVTIVLNLAPRVSPILIWDEPLANLSPEYEGQSDAVSGYRDRMATFLRTLVHEAGVQIVMVTHEPNFGLAADIHHRFEGGTGKVPKVITSRYKADSNMQNHTEARK